MCMKTPPLRRCIVRTVFQITFQDGVPSTNFKGSIDVGLSRASQVFHLFCQVRWPAVSGVDPTHLSYMEHCEKEC